MSIKQGQAVEQQIRIAAPPETIFAYFTDPEKMMQWKGVALELDPQPGGIYYANMNGQNIARGEYIEVTPFTRVVFSWGWEGANHPMPPGSTQVEVTLTPDGDQTIVRLRHEGIPPELADTHAEGWNHYLPRLRLAAEGHDPGPDPWIRSADVESSTP